MLSPLVALCLVVLPFAGRAFTNVGITVTYACFMLGTVLMMMCAQVSRDSGVNPVFIYTFYALCAYALQTLGYALGFASGLENAVGA